MPPIDSSDQDPSLIETDPPLLATNAPASTVYATNGAAVPAPPEERPPPAVLHPSLVLALAVAIAGLATNLGSLKLTERLVQTFPSVPDVIQARLPYVDFGVPGEFVFVAFLITCATRLIRRQPRSVASVLCLVGAFYAIRGVFLFLLPIGSPPTAPAETHRFVMYPYANHAYFPGGHAGLMTILSLSMADRRWRRALMVVTIVFAVGSVMARHHYTADVLAGGLLGYALVSWGRGKLAHLSPNALLSR
jgi:membrane-associated phospholipid phosphatase